MASRPSRNQKIHGSKNDKIYSGIQQTQLLRLPLLNGAGATSSQVQSLSSINTLVSLQRYSRYFQRRIGQQREDRFHDKLLLLKSIQILVFASLSLVATGLLENLSDMNILLPLQIVLSLSSVISALLTYQYYLMVLLAKRLEWSDLDMIELVKPPYQESPHDYDERMRAKKKLKDSYSLKPLDQRFSIKFWIEILIHILHPVLFIENEILVKFLNMCILLRLYTVVRVIHLQSQIHRDRFEIVFNAKQSGAMIPDPDCGLTYQIYLQTQTGGMILVWSFLTLIIGGLAIFVFEGNVLYDGSASPNWASEFDNNIYFCFIAATTIGYGDYFPVSYSGRVVTALVAISGFVLTRVAQAVVTNKMKPTRYEQYIRDYLIKHDEPIMIRNRAAAVIQTVWRLKKHVEYYQKVGNSRFFAKEMKGDSAIKSNYLFRKLKRFRHCKRKDYGLNRSNDVVLEEQINDITFLLSIVSTRIQRGSESFIVMQKKIDKQLALIKRLVNGELPEPPSSRNATPNLYNTRY